jgi:hypothetical protein
MTKQQEAARMRCCSAFVWLDRLAQRLGFERKLVDFAQRNDDGKIGMTRRTPRFGVLSRARAQESVTCSLV